MIDTKRDMKAAYERLYERPLTSEEIQDADNNLFGFLSLLSDIDQSITSNSSLCT